MGNETFYWDGQTSKQKKDCSREFLHIKKIQGGLTEIKGEQCRFPQLGNLFWKIYKLGEVKIAQRKMYASTAGNGWKMEGL